MKIHGKKIEGANVEICVIPRGNGEDIVFRCQAVLDMSDFEKLCPEPVPPTVIKPGGVRILDLENGIFKAQQQQQGAKRIDYMVLKSLEATSGLEWETIQMGDPSTWVNYREELKEAGFSSIEVMRIVNCCMTANCLDDARLERAREAFLTSAAAHSNGKSYIPEVEQLSMVSGEPVKDSESSPQE